VGEKEYWQLKNLPYLLLKTALTWRTSSPAISQGVFSGSTVKLAINNHLPQLSGMKTNLFHLFLIWGIWSAILWSIGVLHIDVVVVKRQED